MTVFDIVRRVVKYGPCGVKLWASLKLIDIRLRRFINQNAKLQDFAPERGVTLVGSFTGRDSINKVMRDLLFMVRDTGIPFQALNTGANEDPAGTGVLELLTPPERFRVRKHPLVIEMFNGCVEMLPDTDPASALKGLLKWRGKPATLSQMDEAIAREACKF